MINDLEIHRKKIYRKKDFNCKNSINVSIVYIYLREMPLNGRININNCIIKIIKFLLILKTNKFY